MREISAIYAGSYLYIWFVFYVSLPNQIKLLLFDIFFFDINTPTIIEHMQLNRSQESVF